MLSVKMQRGILSLIWVKILKKAMFLGIRGSTLVIVAMVLKKDTFRGIRVLNTSLLSGRDILYGRVMGLDILPYTHGLIEIREKPVAAKIRNVKAKTPQSLSGRIRVVNIKEILMIMKVFVFSVIVKKTWEKYHPGIRVRNFIIQFGIKAKKLVLFQKQHGKKGKLQRDQNYLRKVTSLGIKNRLLITTSAGNVYVSCGGWEI